MSANEYPTEPAAHPLLQLMHDYRDNIVNWAPKSPHTKEVKRRRARNKLAKASRKANRGK